MVRYQIVSWAQTWKLVVSAEKKAHIEREGLSYLGKGALDFGSGVIDWRDICNADETHFLINLDNHRTLGRCDETDVKYADVVSGYDIMTIMIRISGWREAMIEAPFMVFQNCKRNHPIQALPDDIPGVSYRTGPKSWMDRAVFPQYLREKKVLRPLPQGRLRIIYINNCGSTV